MNATERDKAMDELEEARKHLAACEEEVCEEEVGPGMKEYIIRAKARVEKARRKIRKIEQQFPEVRLWGQR